MNYRTPKSRCGLCNSEFTRQGFTRHTKSCLNKNLQKPSKAKPRDLLYLHVYDAFNPDYFLHLLIVENSTLRDLDAFLRSIWLECCGHMSSFSQKRFGEAFNMNHKVEDVFIPGTELCYQYDFGSTTELIVRAVDNYFGPPLSNDQIQILTRNAQPIIPCDECRAKPAVQVCSECQWDGKGWLCEECSQTHECDDEMFLPVVNSPRTGVCGYTGE